MLVPIACRRSRGRCRRARPRFLNAEYRWLAIFVVVVAAAIFFSSAENGLGPRTAIAFVCGALASGVAGYFGMHTATRAAVRTTQAARDSLASALGVSFSSGVVMGMSVVGLALLGVVLFTWLYVFQGGFNAKAIEYVLGFSFGASSIALFARVGGGIFTKAADVGADLVGKVEAGIPEDDPAIRAPSPTTWATTWATWPAWAPTSSSPTCGSMIATMIAWTPVVLPASSENMDRRQPDGADVPASWRWPRRASWPRSSAPSS